MLKWIKNMLSGLVIGAVSYTHLFRITITETKNSPNATNNANRPDFKSRFSDLKFGEQK